MKTFYYKVFDYIYSKRLELFQSLFYELYKNFPDQEEFIKYWFERYTLSKLLKYFPLEDIIRHYPFFASTKRGLLRSYVRAYWSMCSRPTMYPAKVKEAMEFFGIKELSPAELKSAYRRLVKTYHPDRYYNRKEAHKKMLLINYHYQVLLSYTREKQHD